MEISALEYFVKICETGNISQAAEALFVTRQAVSRSLMHLENMLGVKLVERKHDGIVITKQGGYLYTQAKFMLDMWQETKQTLVQLDHAYRRHLRVGFGFACYNYWAGKPIHEFCKQYPDLDLSMEIMLGDALEEALLKKEIDIAVSNATYPSSALSQSLLCKKPVMCLLKADDPLSKEETLSLEHMAGRTLLIVQNNKAFYKELQLCLSKKNISCNIQFLHSHDVISILREISSQQNFVHMTYDCFSDMLNTTSYASRPLNASLSGLHKNLRAYYQKDEANDLIIQEYVKYLRQQIKSV